MKLQILKTFYALLFALFSTVAIGQVAIGELPATGMEDGVIFQLESPDKGLLIPRVQLLNTLDTTTMDPGNVEGLWVYNIGPSGSGVTSVTEGMYFWDGGAWVRIYNEGYSEQFFQTGIQKALNQTTSYPLPGLTQTISAPYSGTYQIIVVCYYSCGLNSLNSSLPAIGTSSVWLEIDGTKVAEDFLVSNSKKIQGGGTFLALGQTSTIIHNVDLNAGQDYTFSVVAREWDENNSLNGAFGPNGYGFWGVNSSAYNGNQHTGSNSDALDNYLTITLLRQF